MDQINFIDTYQDEKVIKPWGDETIFTPNNLNYTFKMLHIKKDCRISLQSHTEKVETFVLVQGKAQLLVGLDLNSLQTIEMEPMRGYTIQVNTIHRMIAIEGDAIIFEGSTPETGTTVRYQDDYNRPDETEEMRKQENRGWTSETNDRTAE